MINCYDHHDQIAPISVWSLALISMRSSWSLATWSKNHIMYSTQNNNHSHGEWAHGTLFPTIWYVQKKTFDLLWSSFAGLCCQAYISYQMYKAPVGRRLCSKYFSTFHQCSRLVSGKSHHCPKCLLCSKTNDFCTWYIATKPMVT